MSFPADAARRAFKEALLRFSDAPTRANFERYRRASRDLERQRAGRRAGIRPIDEEAA